MRTVRLSPTTWKTTTIRTTIETTTPQTAVQEIHTNKEILRTTAKWNTARAKSSWKSTKNSKAASIEPIGSKTQEQQENFDEINENILSNEQQNVDQTDYGKNILMRNDYGKNLPNNYQENLSKENEMSNLAENVENLPIIDEKYKTSLPVKYEEIYQSNEENLPKNMKENVPIESNNIENYASYTYPSNYGNIGFNDPWVQANFQS